MHATSKQWDASRSTVIGGYVAAVFRALEARGVSIRMLLDESGLDHVPANDPLSRVPMPRLRRLFEGAVRVTDDPYFGLYAASFLHPGNLHALGLSLEASADLRDFCARLARYFRFLSGTTSPRLREEEDVASLEFLFATEPPPALNEDMFGLFLVRMIADLSDGRVRPQTVALHRAAPPDAGVAHRRAFDCPVLFGAPHSRIAFDRAALDQPFSGASRELAEHNDRIVVAYLSKLDRSDIQSRVRALLLQDMPSGAVTKEAIARKLAMSPRTLQVKLSRAGTTFQTIVNETRLALARGYIENSAMPITEIAYLLGFSDTSNFSRAFRRWTGLSPSEQRERREPRENGAPR